MIDGLATCGYAEAVAREQMVRDASFLPVNEKIGEFEVLPMTLRHYLILRMMRSPLLTGGMPGPVELTQFLWVLSPRYTPRNGLGRWMFFRRCRKFIPASFPGDSPRAKAKRQKAVLRAAQIINESVAYINDALQDRQPSSGGGGPCKSYFSDAAGTCALFAREFGWDDEATLQKPMKRLLQYMKEMSVSRGSKIPLCNPSDDKINEFLIAKNQKEKAA